MCAYIDDIFDEGESVLDAFISDKPQAVQRNNVFENKLCILFFLGPCIME